MKEGNTEVVKATENSTSKPPPLRRNHFSFEDVYRFRNRHEMQNQQKEEDSVSLQSIESSNTSACPSGRASPPEMTDVGKGRLGFQLANWLSNQQCLQEKVSAKRANLQKCHTNFNKVFKQFTNRDLNAVSPANW
ncbi:DgyrCDS2153 [Dimorphilus gyrociliatus]|uniref:DgyrCDS2153 n=1 Tax=Dimorphilus gyrociliatus TaxID=2664684 RepID=A0A7I8VB78_9ANNE|nr:DgyrCDS2153 [Dimorphilus gyrociliatus]